MMQRSRGGSRVPTIQPLCRRRRDEAGDRLRRQRIYGEIICQRRRRRTHFTPTTTTTPHDRMNVSMLTMIDQNMNYSSPPLSCSSFVLPLLELGKNREIKRERESLNLFLNRNHAHQ